MESDPPASPCFEAADQAGSNTAIMPRGSLEVSATILKIDGEMYFFVWYDTANFIYGISAQSKLMIHLAE